jgi:hypothetical protein
MDYRELKNAYSTARIWQWIWFLCLCVMGYLWLCVKCDNIDLSSKLADEQADNLQCAQANQQERLLRDTAENNALDALALRNLEYMPLEQFVTTVQNNTHKHCFNMPTREWLATVAVAAEIAPGAFVAHVVDDANTRATLVSEYTEAQRRRVIRAVCGFSCFDVRADA